MATKIGGITVELKALTATFEKNMKEATKAVKGVGSSVKETAIQAAALFGAFKAASAISQYTKDAFSAIAATARMSDQFAVSTESLQGMKVQAELAGLKMEDMAKALEKVQGKLGDAVTGSQEARDAFHNIGITWTNLQTMRPDQMLGTVSDALNQVSDASAKAKYAQDIFGKSSDNLAGIIAQGSKGMQESAEQAVRLGVSFDRVDAAKVELAAQASTKLKLVLEGIGNRLAIASAPFIEAIADSLVKASGEAGNFQSAIDMAMKIAQKVVGYAANYVQAMVIAWRAVGLGAVKAAEYFLIFKEYAADAIHYVNQYIENHVRLIKAVANVISSSFEVAWALVRVQVSAAVAFAARAMEPFVAIVDMIKAEFKGASDLIGGVFEFQKKIASKIMESAVDGARFVAKKYTEAYEAIAGAAEKMAPEIRAAATSAARSMLDAIKKFDADSASGLESATKKYLDSATEMKNALVGVFDFKPRDSSSGKAMIDSVHKLGDEMKAGLTEAIQAPWLNKSVIDPWFDAVNKRAAESAKKIAEASPSRKPVDSGLPIQDDNKKLQDQLIALQKDMFETSATMAQKEIALHQEKLQKIAELEQAADEEGTNYAAEVNAIREAEEERHQKAMIDAKYAAIDKELDMTNSMTNSLMAISQGRNKKMFQVAKMAAYGQAIVSTAAGVAKTFEQLGWYALFGPAEAVALAGAAQIAAISSQSFGGGGGGKPSGGGGAGSVNIPDTSNVGGPGVSGSGRGPARIAITLNGTSFTAQQVRDLIDQINEAQADGKGVN